jgi:hypothetical protein
MAPPRPKTCMIPPLNMHSAACNFMLCLQDVVPANLACLFALSTASQMLVMLAGRDSSRGG